MYPTGCFDEEYFNSKLIKDLAYTADDIWLKFTELRLGIKVMKIAPHTKIPFVIGGTQKVALGKENNGMKKNDAIIDALCNHYQHIKWKEL